MSEEERAIRDLITTWLAASTAGDLDKVLSLMADDVVFMVPGKAFGKSEFAKASAGMKDVRIESRSTIDEIKVLGDWAWSRTHLTVTMAAPSAKPVRRAGYLNRNS